MSNICFLSFIIKWILKNIYQCGYFFIIGIPNAKDRMIEAGCVDSGCKL
ncbi:hypothetical protein ANACOL_03945 [Anaerotruncus colihominis DSM 17241]|uniref:Uncharacterized protein n=1 Tax=Anaerotruncus colihominis DSM 17241 TaxID=445972 RepID=B0PGS7_9FIRM|nr:hypothetical protein ANACOL_03945 [Anaerotruncus colihominis DSM 17241]